MTGEKTARKSHFGDPLTVPTIVKHVYLQQIQLPPPQKKNVLRVDERLTHGVGVEEAAGRPYQPAEHGVVQVDRGLHAQHEEVDRPHHGAHHETEHNGGVDAKVGVMLREVGAALLLLQADVGPGGVGLADGHTLYTSIQSVSNSGRVW